MRSLTLLGSTGSIGVSTLAVVASWPHHFRIHALVAGRNVERLSFQIRDFHPHVAVVESDDARTELMGRMESLGLPREHWPQLECGPRARVQAAVTPECDFVLSAIVGVAGLEATYEAVRARKQIGLANKEVLVASGQLVMDASRESGTELIPVDSEHNGAHQALRCGRPSEVRRLILTASGGPFRKTPTEELRNVTPEQALKHPTWKMGQRITVDSATMMNKGFEVIEACWLFGLDPDDVGVVVHPSSSVHAMVEYADGSVMAQMSTTDMKMPIQYALTYPDRWEAPAPRMDWNRPQTLEFFPPDLDKFPCLELAYEAQRAGGSATCTLNAADEIAVEAFLSGKISYPAIVETVRETLARVAGRTLDSVAEVLEVDRKSREVARQIVTELGR